MAPVLQMNRADVPSLEIKLGALAVLLSVTLIFGFIPFCIIRGAGRCNVDPDVRRFLLSLISCFAGGVFLATCLLDLLPDYLQGITEAFSNAGITLHFPLPEFIMAMGFFLVLVLEQIVLAFREQSSSSSSSSSSQGEERRALLADSSGPAPMETESVLRALVLVLSLSVHSVFEGLAVGLLEEGEEVLEMVLALVIHKSVVAFSLSFQLIRGRLRRSVVAACLLAFAAMSPLGVGVGVALMASKASPRLRLARSTLEGLAVGTFFYVTFMEILPHELSSPRGRRIPKMAALLGGFTTVTGVLFIRL